MALRLRRVRVRRPRPVRSIKDLERASQELRLSQRRGYGWALLALLVIQLVAADTLMYLYAGKREWWNIPEGIMKAWLAATVVQLIGLVYVVVSHLFPKDGA